MRGDQLLDQPGVHDVVGVGAAADDHRRGEWPGDQLDGRDEAVVLPANRDVIARQHRRTDGGFRRESGDIAVAPAPREHRRYPAGQPSAPDRHHRGKRDDDGQRDAGPQQLEWRGQGDACGNQRGRPYQVAGGEAQPE